MSTPSPKTFRNESSLSIFRGGVGHHVLFLERKLGNRVNHGVREGFLLRVLATLVVLVVPLLLIGKKLDGEVGDEKSSENVVSEDELVDRTRNWLGNVLDGSSGKQEVVGQSCDGEQNVLSDGDKEDGEDLPHRPGHSLAQQRPSVVLLSGLEHSPSVGVVSQPDAPEQR